MSLLFGNSLRMPRSEVTCGTQEQSVLQVKSLLLPELLFVWLLT